LVLKFGPAQAIMTWRGKEQEMLDAMLPTRIGTADTSPIDQSELTGL
jgi:hypothetical protein